MKRYRICSFDLDSRASILNTIIKDEWDDKVKSQWKKNIDDVLNSVITQVGTSNRDEKVGRFKRIGSKPFSIISYHNELLSDIRSAFIAGSFYSSLNGACALEERMFFIM
jgi:hypothetical protein